ncbi:uncharacterized membrane protein YcaP (DUF421 family) [Melghiribacillus thermohalophilus]|uniref:Uncharacterized membrane protein YcaP (DUF421 family) n=1 Tax=Melghiribacillus thermohalophilus TaxID=1324956 RepID=A0A4R3N068_9BACI|nr:DUF421 domain-containing protein [Melghiribacillus thermohalophilus]TCT22388.1 uncharacterized membrane protein YcaP (DUF421 family) [Melghiribacillus thermohalophilus]
MNYFNMLVDTLVGFIALFALTKILGKSQITQITAFDFIAALVLGELVGNALFDEKAGVPEILYVVFLWGTLLYVTEMITQKFKGSRALLEGKPALIIHKGKINKEEMQKNKLDLNQLLHLLRKKDVFSVRDVEYAIFETDGSVSVLQNTIKQQATRQDVNAPPEPVELPVSLIIDGELLYDNLAESNLTEQWLHQELQKQGYSDVKDIMYAEWQESKGLYVQPY